MDSFAEAFIETNPSLWSSFVDQCRKACADPFRAGKPLARVGHKALRGRIRRLWVGGPGGHRFFFIADKAKQVILPVYLSLEVRKNIDYDQVPWEQYASEIYSDFVKGNIQAFHFMNLPK
jgi:hypothetical protein